MKRVFNFLKLRYIYIYFLIYVAIDYFFEGKISNLGIFDFIKSYFGITVFPLIVILIFSILFPFITNQTKKMLLSVRLYCFFLLSISCILLYLMYILDLPFNKVVADERTIKKFIELSIYKYKIGLVATYGFYLLLTNVVFMYIYISLGVIIFCTTFLISARCINRSIKKLYHDFKERRRIAREEQLIREQIAIKEALERREAMMKEKFEREKENKIKEKVDEVLLNKEIIIETQPESVEDIENHNLSVINDLNKSSENIDENEDKETDVIEKEEDNNLVEDPNNLKENQKTNKIKEESSMVEEKKSEESEEQKQEKTEEINKKIDDVEAIEEKNRVEKRKEEKEILNNDKEIIETKEKGEKDDTSIEITEKERDS